VAGVTLALDGTTVATPRIAELVPGRALLRWSDEGLLPAEGPLDDAMVGALQLLEDPEVRVDVDVAVRRSGREWRVRSWQGLRGGRVATVSTVDGHTYELSWLVDDMWRLELARAATVTQPFTGAPGPPVVPDLVELPYELLLATGAAWHRRRTDLIAELGRGLGDGLRIDGGPIADDRTPLLTALHAEARGRLQALVSRGGLVGQISWLRYGDGWRQLTPYTRGRERFVRVEKVDEFHLGVEVARLVTGVRT
jgi:hypothetical protein